MKNWRRIVVTGLVAGMVAFTGCSSNLPETNQGNRNGQRVVDAVNHRADTYNANRTRSSGTRRHTARRLDGTRSVRGFNRGFRRAARNDGVGTRNVPGATTPRTGSRHSGLGARSYSQPRTNHVARSTPNRSVGAHNQYGRVGHTFGYNSGGHMQGLYDDGGYDLGQRIDASANRSVTPGVNSRNAANINNRVVRSSAARNATMPRAVGNAVTRNAGVGTGVARKAVTGTAVTRKANTGTAVTRSANTGTAVTRNANTTGTAVTHKAKTGTAVTRKANVGTTATHKANVTRSAPITKTATPKPSVTHKAQPTRSATPARNTAPTRNTAPARKIAPARSTAPTRSTTQTRATTTARNTQPFRNAARIRNSTLPSNIALNHNVQPIRSTQALRSVAQSNLSTHNITGERPTQPPISPRANPRRSNATVHHMQGIYNPNVQPARGISRNTTTGLNSRQPVAQNRSERRAATTRNINRHNQVVNQAVYANAATQDGDYAFFKRNKTENQETPATPEPSSNPTGRINTHPAPTTMPTQPSSRVRGNDIYNAEYRDFTNDINNDTRGHGADIYNNEGARNVYDADNGRLRHDGHINGAERMTNNIHDIDDDNTNNHYDSGQLRTTRYGEPTTSVPIRRSAQRAMK